MSVTLYSFLMTVLASNVVMMMLFLCCRSSRVVGTVGLSPLLICAALCMLRICIPIEFGFAREVNIPSVYNPIYEFFSGDVMGGRVSVLQIAAIVSTTASLVMLFRLLFVYFRYRRVLSALPGMSTLQVLEITGKIMTEKDRARIRIIAAAPDDIPKTLGVWKPLILLPLRPYSNKELELILRHEYTHCKNKDVLIKWIVEILCIVFWWCPALYLFKFGLSSILEIRCDLAVVKDQKESTVRYYLKTIAKIAEISLGLGTKRRSYVTSGLAGDRELLQRVRVLLRYRKKKHSKVLALVCVTLAVAIFLCSYLFVFQSAYDPPMEDIIYSGDIAGDGLYTEKNSDGTYTVFNGIKEQIMSEEEYLVFIQGLKNS